MLQSSCVSDATWELGEPRSPLQCPCQSESLKIQKQSCRCHFPTTVSVPASPSLWRSFPEPSVLRQNLETDRFGFQPSCFLALTFHWSLLLTGTSLEKPGSYPPRWRHGPGAASGRDPGDVTSEQSQRMSWASPDGDVPEGHAGRGHGLSAKDCVCRSSLVRQIETRQRGKEVGQGRDRGGMGKEGMERQERKGKEERREVLNHSACCLPLV